MVSRKKKDDFESAHPMVRVEWRDSANMGRWRPLSDVKDEPAYLDCVSVGFLLREGDDGVLLAGTHDTQKDPGDTNVNAPHVIPKGAVTSIKRLRVSGKK